MSTLRRQTASDDATGEMETGCFADTSAEPRARGTIIVASFNIRYAVGSHLISGGLGRRLGLCMPGRRPRLVERNLDRAASAFSDGRRLPAPQILALQETDQETIRAGGHDVARELAQKLKMDYALAV